MIVMNNNDQRSSSGYNCRFVAIHNQSISFTNILTNCIDWEIVRIILIGFYKNDENDKCHIASVGKDVVFLIVAFLADSITIQNKNDDQFQIKHHK